METRKYIMLLSAICSVALYAGFQLYNSPSIPLPEHPRPDFSRMRWINLNGYWDFEFDPNDVGESRQWQSGRSDFSDRILVPFPWGSPLSGVENKADIAWYARDLAVPESWSGQRIFIVIGASDWHTRVWLDGEYVGEHRGGYTPFDIELTDYVRSGSSHRLVIKVDDAPNDSKLFGKQGYGPAKGIWQTPYLEARAGRYIRSVHFSPDIQKGIVAVAVQADSAVQERASLGVRIAGETGDTLYVEENFRRRRSEIQFEVEIPDARLWSLEDPHLYEAQVVLQVDGMDADTVHTYFGMRQVGVAQFPGTDYPYVAINNKPVYLQLALDQAYHPDGYYTFPSDDFIREEIIRTKKIGLNGQRVHVKVPVPRKLYWADKLGVLVMADVPNAWGTPDSMMRAETEHAMRNMIRRDFNHPSVFSWVLFNETWGLRNKTDSGSYYLEETKAWVADMVGLARDLDPTRLVEDNSPNSQDHVATDLNTWHAYLPGYAWAEHLKMVTDSTYIGSPWNFADGYSQSGQPLLNSECGNVWGYKGSTGNVDWSWDYHIMLNQFRKHPKIGGWLYTEHHDVINEWNGYYAYDRGPKYTGLGDIMPGMQLQDLHSIIYVSPGDGLCTEAVPGELVAVPLWLSVLGDRYRGQQLELHNALYGWDVLGRMHQYSEGRRAIGEDAWFSGEIAPLVIRMPQQEGLMVLGLSVQTSTGVVLHRNFTTFLIAGPEPDKAFRPTKEEDLVVLQFAPDSYTDASWSIRQWEILDGLKVNGAGTGYFEYEIDVPGDLDSAVIGEGALIIELSSKPLLGKDIADGEGPQDDGYMLGKGFHDPGRNPNAYPMTDAHENPSAVRFTINGVESGWEYLPDDPADHRGILSWHAQPRDRTLHEAGTYGYLYTIPMPRAAIDTLRETGKVVVRLEVDATMPGGLAVYGRSFGRYPVDPSLVFRMSSGKN
jgi:hypothetical protein